MAQVHATRSSTLASLARGRTTSGGTTHTGIDADGLADHLGIDHAITGAVGGPGDQHTSSTPVAAGPGGSAASTGRHQGGGNETLDVIDAVLPKAKISPLRREACELLRKFAFGSVGNERKKGSEKDKVFQETCGTKEQVKILFSLWDKLDSDNAGAVDILEFRGFVERLVGEAKGDRRPSMQGGRRDESFQVTGLSVCQMEEIVKKMCDRVASVMLAKKMIQLEDMMRIIWSCSSLDNLKQMRAWCDEMRASKNRWRTATPPVLDAVELASLQAVFQFYDKDHSGFVTAEELVNSGLLDKDNKYSAFDGDLDAQLDVHKFCEIMCPTGCRAKADALRGTNKEGRPVIYDRRLGGWRFEDESEFA